MTHIDVSNQDLPPEALELLVAGWTLDTTTIELEQLEHWQVNAPDELNMYAHIQRRPTEFTRNYYVFHYYVFHTDSGAMKGFLSWDATKKYILKHS